MPSGPARLVARASCLPIGMASWSAQPATMGRRGCTPTSHGGTVTGAPDRPSDTAGEPDRAALFRRYVMPELQLLHAMAMRLTRDPHDAEDLVQDTLLRAHRGIDRFDGRYPRAWLLTILRNTHINRIRKRTPHLAFDPDALFGQLPADDGRDTVAEDALDRIADPVLVAAFDRLSEAHRSIVSLVDVDGLSYLEAAELLDIPIGTVMSRLHRGRTRLRAILERDGHVRKGLP